MVLCSCPDVMRGCSEMNMAGHKPSQQFGKAGKAMAPQLAVVGPTINGYPSYLACASTANSMRADLRNTPACPPSALAIPWACRSPARGAASTPNRNKGCTLPTTLSSTSSKWSTSTNRNCPPCYPRRPSVGARRGVRPSRLQALLLPMLLASAACDVRPSKYLPTANECCLYVLLRQLLLLLLQLLQLLLLLLLLL